MHPATTNVLRPRCLQRAEWTLRLEMTDPKGKRQGAANLNSSRRKRPAAPIKIHDDWGEQPPIDLTEIRLVEAYLSRVLDDLLGPLP